MSLKNIVIIIFGIIAVAVIAAVISLNITQESEVSTRVSAREIVHQSFPSGPATRIVFDSEKYDEKGEYDTSTGLFTAQKDGYYLVYAQIVLDYFPANNSFSVEIRKNGASLEARAYGVNDYTTPRITMAQIQDVLYLNANDTVEITVQQNTGNSIKTTGYNYFIIHRLP